MIRSLVSGLLVVAMCAVGVGVYFLLGSLRSQPATQRPEVGTAVVDLPGAVYLAQGGALYRLAHRKFTRLTPAEGWMQPEVSPDASHLVAVKRAGNYSDLYLLGLNGKVLAQLTHNASNTIELNHWAFFPRFGPDGSAVFYSYDPKDFSNNYRVDLAVFALSAAPDSGPGRRWSHPNPYTGGDVAPIPLQNGGVLYTKYSIDRTGDVHSQVWVQARAGSVGLGLTRAEDDCSQPALSSDQSLIAMVCRHGRSVGDLEVAGLDLANYELSSPRVLVGARLIASPSFSPNGQSLAFFAPAADGGPFQLWTVSVGSTAHPPAPVVVTRNLDLDPAAAPAWT